jgi:hypothetical protein
MQKIKSIKVDIGVDWGNHSFKCSLKCYKEEESYDILNYSPPENELDEYNRKSSIWIPFNLDKENIKRVILEEQDEVYEKNGEKFLDLSLDDIILDFSFNGKNLEDKDGVFRCIKSQFFEGVFQEKSEFFTKVCKKITKNGIVYKFFWVGNIDGVNLLVNSNLLFDRLYVLTIEKALEFLSYKIRDLYRIDESIKDLIIKVYCSVPLGSPTQLINEDQKIEEHLNEVFSKTRFSVKRSILHGELFNLVKYNDDKSDMVIFNTKVKFKSSYELVVPLLNVLSNYNPKTKSILYVKDVGSLTSQGLILFVDRKEKFIRVLNAESRYAGGMNFNEVIIERYYDGMNVEDDKNDKNSFDPEEFFWIDSKNSRENFKTLEDLKKQILSNPNDFVVSRSFFGRSDSKEHKIDFDFLKLLITQHYKKFMEKEVDELLKLKAKIEKFLKKSNENDIVGVLLGESFNSRGITENDYRGMKIMSNGLSFFKDDNLQYEEDINFISKNLLNQNLFKTDYTLYDNLGVVNYYKEKEMVFLCDSRVGNQKKWS